MNSKSVILSLCMAIGAVAAGSASAQTIHAYEFNNGLTDSVVGGVALQPSFRGTATGTVSGGFYNFQQGAGLSLNSQLPGATYTIDIMATFANVDGYRKLVSFNNLNDDAGLYIYNGGLTLFNVATGSANVVAAGTAFDARLSRNGATGLITGYLNGVLQFSYTDTANSFLASTNLYFLRDDLAQNGEDSAGSADFIRISNVATGAPPVVPPVSGVPEASTWAMMIAGFGMVGFAMRRRQKIAVSYAA